MDKPTPKNPLCSFLPSRGRNTRGGPSCFLRASSLLFAVALLALSAPAQAQPAPPPPPGWERPGYGYGGPGRAMTPEEREQWREERRQRREAWREMSPEERHQLRQDVREAGRMHRRGYRAGRED